MKQKVYQLIHKYLNETMDLREQIFHQLLLIGMVLGVLIGISSIITNAGIVSIVVNFATSAAAFAMLEYSSRTEKNKLLYLISVIFVFMIIFPVLFFTSGGYHSGTPSFFVFAIVFTVFILEGKSRYIIVALEIFFYIGICLFAYHYPETVFFFETEHDSVADIVIGFTVASAALGITVFRYTRIYDNKQRQLSEAVATLDGTNKMKTEFLEDIKHEIRTPLTAISLGTEVALNNVGASGNEQKAHNALYTVQNEAMRLGRMINGMVELANMSEKTQNRKRIDFAAMLKEQAEAARFELEAKRNRLRVEIAPDLPYIYAESEQIERVPANLLDNAIDFTENGEITLEAFSEENYISVRVRDTGAGISPELLPRVFERGVSGRDGNGYGLSYCKTIVEAHGGVIDATSEQGKGTAVTFTIPVYGGQDYRVE